MEVGTEPAGDLNHWGSLGSPVLPNLTLPFSLDSAKTSSICSGPLIKSSKLKPSFSLLLTLLATVSVLGCWLLELSVLGELGLVLYCVANDLVKGLV